MPHSRYVSPLFLLHQLRQEKEAKRANQPVVSFTPEFLSSHPTLPATTPKVLFNEDIATIGKKPLGKATKTRNSLANGANGKSHLENVNKGFASPRKPTQGPSSNANKIMTTTAKTTVNKSFGSTVTINKVPLVTPKTSLPPLLRNPKQDTLAFPDPSGQDQNVVPDLPEYPDESYEDYYYYDNDYDRPVLNDEIPTSQASPLPGYHLYSPPAEAAYPSNEPAVSTNKTASAAAGFEMANKEKEEEEATTTTQGSISSSSSSPITTKFERDGLLENKQDREGALEIGEGEEKRIEELGGNSLLVLGDGQQQLEKQLLQQGNYNRAAALQRARQEFKKVARPNLCFRGQRKRSLIGQKKIIFRFCLLDSSQEDMELLEVFPRDILETADCILDGQGQEGVQDEQVQGFHSPMTCLKPSVQETSEDMSEQAGQRFGGFRDARCLTLEPKRRNKFVPELCVEILASLNVERGNPMFERRLCVFPETRGRKKNGRALGRNEEIDLVGLRRATEMVCVKQDAKTTQRSDLGENK